MNSTENMKSQKKLYITGNNKYPEEDKSGKLNIFFCGSILYHILLTNKIEAYMQFWHLNGAETQIPTNQIQLTEPEVFQIKENTKLWEGTGRWIYMGHQDQDGEKVGQMSLFDWKFDSATDREKQKFIHFQVLLSNLSCCSFKLD